MSDSEQSGRMPTGGNRYPYLGALVAGIVIGVATLGVVWLSVVLLTDGDGGSSPDASEEHAVLNDSPGTSQPAHPTRLERCTAAAGLVERPLGLAQPALDQWEVHVGAMNKLVDGEITLQQATAFWNQTRVGAYHRIGRFEEAEAHLKRRGADCPTPRLFGSGSSPALRACEQHVAAELRALDSADTAITTWKHHMHDMDQLRAGKLSPTAATQMWLTMWHRGVSQLQDYRAAADAAQHVGTCGGAAVSQQPSASPTESPTSGMDMH